MRREFHRGNEIPRHWYNIVADFPSLYEPPINPKTLKEIQPSEVLNLFPEELANQDFNRTDRLIAIPEELIEKYTKWRPTPIFRARDLEKELGTNCKIFYKYEGVSPVGSHKPNTAVAQTYYCKKAGYNEIVTETGAGQVGSSVAMAGSFFNMKSNVFMVKNSYETKPARRIMMQTFGANVYSSPSNQTAVGRDIVQNDPSFSGSLGVAIAEAVEYASARKNTAYIIGSAFNYVCLHQTIIGNELKGQLKQLGIEPNFLISCVGGGSSFAGFAFPFLQDKLDRNLDLEFIAVESNAVPSVSKGVFEYDYGDTARSTPLVKMYTLGHQFAPPVTHSGGLRYHGLSPLVSKFIHDGYGGIETYKQLETFEAAKLFAKCEGYIPAPEAAHSVKAAIDVAKKHKNENKNIFFILTGHGYFDLAGYDKYNRGTLEDSTTYEDKIRESVHSLKSHLVDIDFNKRSAAGSGNRNTGIQSSNRGNRFETWWNRHFSEDKADTGHNTGSVHSSNHSTPSAPSSSEIYKILTEKKVREILSKNQNIIFVSKKCVITPMAKELIEEKKIEIRYE